MAIDLTNPDEKMNVQAKIAPINSVKFLPSMYEKTIPQINPKGNPFSNIQIGQYLQFENPINNSGMVADVKIKTIIRNL